MTTLQHNGILSHAHTLCSLKKIQIIKPGVVCALAALQSNYSFYWQALQKAIHTEGLNICTLLYEYHEHRNSTHTQK